MRPNRSQVVRVVSNYVRLFSTLIIGLFVVRLLLRLGDDAFALVALLGTGTGIALMLKQVVRTSTVPILGEAFHSDRPDWFEQVFNSALLCSLLAGILTLAFFALFGLALPLLNFPPILNQAAVVFLISSGVHSFVNITLSPFINFYLVSERMVSSNLMLFLERLGDLAAILLTLLCWGSDRPAAAIMTYGIVTAMFYIAISLVGAILISRAEPRLKLNRKLINNSAIRAFLKSVGWNSCVIFAVNLHARVDMVIMNLYFGLFGNMVFGLANQAVGYMRQLIFGLVNGLDAVAARKANSSGDQAVVLLMNRSLKFQAMIIFPAIVGLLVVGDTLLSLWLQARLEDPSESLPAIGLLMRILLVGVAARCLSEGWMFTMNGAGNVNRYAVAVLVGGLLNPICSVVALQFTPEPYRFAAVACVFSAIMFFVHLVAIPMAVTRTYRTSYLSLITPIGKPLILSLASWGVAQSLTAILVPGIDATGLFVTVFLLLAILGTYAWVLDSSERLLVNRLLARLSPALGLGKAEK